MENEQTTAEKLTKKNRQVRVPFSLRILRVNAPEWRWILLGSLSSLFSGAAQPIFALLISRIFHLFGDSDVDEQKRLTSIYAGVIFCVGASSGIAEFLTTTSFAKSGEALTMRMRRLTFSALLRQEMGYFDYEGNSVGALLTRLSSDSSALKVRRSFHSRQIWRIDLRVWRAVESEFCSKPPVPSSSLWPSLFLLAGNLPWWRCVSFLCWCSTGSFKVRSRPKRERRRTKARGSNRLDRYEEAIESLYFCTTEGFQYATQAIEHIRTVVSLRQETYFIDRYEQAFNQEFKWVRDRSLIGGSSLMASFRKQIVRLQFVAVGAAIANSVMYFLQGTNFAYGSQLVIRGEMRFDQVFRSVNSIWSMEKNFALLRSRVFVVITFAMVAVGRAMAMIPDYSKGKAAAIRIMRLNERQSLIDPSDQSGITLVRRTFGWSIGFHWLFQSEVEGIMEFHDVSFRYPSRPTVRILRKFSLKCLPKMTTALVGSSGSGKSTTVALLERFYDPWKGKILLDGHDIKVLNLQWLRSVMGLVQQEPVLFNLSIRENIAYGDNTRQLTQQQIEQAAQMANIHESIIGLPQVRFFLFSIWSEVASSLRLGLWDDVWGKGQSTIGWTKATKSVRRRREEWDKTVRLVAIARALIRSPKILLLDEATSALDNKSEHLVQAALDVARADRTSLSIAHRLSTIQKSEKIAVVERGYVKEQVCQSSVSLPLSIQCRLGNTWGIVQTWWDVRQTGFFARPLIMSIFVVMHLLFFLSR